MRLVRIAGQSSEKPSPPTRFTFSQHPFATSGAIMANVNKKRELDLEQLSRQLIRVILKEGNRIIEDAASNRRQLLGDFGIRAACTEEELRTLNTEITKEESEVANMRTLATERQNKLRHIKARVDRARDKLEGNHYERLLRSDTLRKDIGTLQREIGELNDQIESLKKFQEELGIHFLGKPKGQKDTIFKYTNIKASGSLCYLYLSNFERTEFDFKFSAVRVFPSTPQIAEAVENERKKGSSLMNFLFNVRKILENFQF